MPSILIMDTKPGDCQGCRLYVDKWCYGRSAEDKDTRCPLKEISLMEHKIRPLSKEHFTKIYIEE